MMQHRKPAPSQTWFSGFPARKTQANATTPQSKAPSQHRIQKAIFSVTQSFILLVSVIAGIVQPTLPQALSVVQPLIGAPQAALAAGGSAVLVSKIPSTTTMLSGETFRYKIKFTCSGNTAAETCDNVVITDTIAAQFSNAPGDVVLDGPDSVLASTSMDLTTRVVTWTLKSVVEPGTAAELGLSLKFPNGSTPNGTTVTNTVRGSTSAGPLLAVSSVPVSAQAADHMSFIKSIGIPTSTLPLDAPVPFNLLLCPTGQLGSLNAQNTSFTEYLPSGATYVAGSANPTPTTVTSSTLTWNAAAFSTPDLDSAANCRRVRFRLIFPSGAYNLGDTNVNTATATYTPVGQTVKTVTASVPLTIGLPIADPEIHKNGADETAIGSNSLIYYNMSVINKGNTDLLNYVVTDTVPGNFQTEAIVRPSLNDPDPLITTTVGATVTFWTKTGVCPTGGAITFSGYPCVIPFSNNGQTYRVYNSNPYPSVNPFASNPLLNLSASDAITQVVWRFAPIPAGYNYAGPSVIGNYKSPGWDGSTFGIGSVITNNYGTSADNANSAVVTATTTVVTGTSLPKVDKSVLNGSSVVPMDLVTFRLSLSNSPQAAEAITAPVIADLLPPELDFVSYVPWENDGTQTSSGVYQTSGFGASQVNMITATAPTVSVVQNYSGTGRTLMRFTWGPGAIVPPQHKFVIDIVTQVKPGTTYGTYHNELAYFPAGADDNRLCETGTDNLDLDADLNSAETVCYNTDRTKSAEFIVNKSAVVESRKFVKGQLDADWHFDPQVGRTVQGGTIDYRFMIKNPGNIPLNNIQLVDVLPFVGDVGEVTQGARGSQWATVWDSALSIAPITGTRTAVTSPVTSSPIAVTLPYTIYYSNSSKPCTDSTNPPDLFDGTSPKPDSCTAPGWSTTFVSATNKSFRVEFDPSLTLYGNQQIAFDLRVRAPLYAPGATAGSDNTFGNSDDGNVAWNTFGFASKREDDGTILAAQPPRVGVEVENFGIGDYVWFDVDHDGVQDTGEPGVPNVTVTLFDATNSFSRTTTTDGNGYYQFDGLINGENYHAVFTPTLGTNITLPSGLVITLDNTLQWTPSLSGTTSADSNVTSSVGTVGTSNAVSVTRSFTASLLSGLPYTVRAEFHNPTLDGGIWMPAKLGNYVWRDSNHDGDQDAIEPPISGLQVDLYENGVFSVSTNTDASGLYTFTQLQPGAVYSVNFALPSLAYTYTQRLNNGNMTNSSSYDTDSNPNWLGDSLTVTLQPGEHNRTVDAGIWGDAGLGDYVWVDYNRNGIQESGEPGLGSVIVKLMENGTNVQTYTTDATGYYGFTNLTPSTPYSVNFTLPNGYSWTLQTVGITTTDSNVNMNGQTEDVTLSNLEFNPTLDAGVWLPARLGNYVWLDDNADGLQTTGEQGLNGITVTLFYSNGASYVPYPYATNTMLTANDPSGKPGYYTFTDLISGTYYVEFALTKGLTFTFPLQGGNAAIDSNVNNIPVGRTGNVVINHGDVIPTVDAGVFTDTVSLGNQVWFDVNDNSTKAGAEVGVNGVRVELYRDSDASGGFSAGDTFVAYSDTVNGGYYTFTELAPSTNNSTTYIVVLSSTNFVAGGPLYGYYSSSYLVAAPDPDNNTNNDDNGTWNSTLGLVAALPISLTLGQEPTNDGDNSKFTNWSVDFGFYKLELGNFVWEDLNNSGTWDSGEPPVSGLNVHLFKGGSEISQTTTSASGFYTFTNLSAGAYTVSVDLPPLWFSSTDIGTSTTPDSNTDNDDNGVNSTGFVTTGLTIASNAINLAGGAEPIVITSTGTTQNPTLDFGLVRKASLGDYVWEDLNHDGVQDAIEPPISGVTVTLYSGGVVQGITTTDGVGYYMFDNLAPGRVYTLNFALPTAPVGTAAYTWTTELHAGNTVSTVLNADDSNVDLNGNTLNVILGSDQHNPTIDAGVWRPARLGNYVWVDDNHNGLQDEAASYGVNGVTVTLYYATALNGSYAPYTAGPSQTLTANDPSSNPGYYTFTNLISGFYYVKFDLPYGYTRTIQTANTSNGSDADVDTGVTAPIQLNAGEAHPHLDAGIWQTAGLGDYVWEDMDRDGVQDVGEPVVPTVTVKLYEDGVLTGTTQTNLSGYYQFVNLFPSKNYTVVFDLPAGFDQFTLENNAGSTISNSTNASNSNADASGQTNIITLTSGQFNPTIDAGVFKYASLGDYVWFDSDKDGQQDANEPPVSNVTVNLYQGGSVIMTTTTDASGMYTFSSLLPGVPYSVAFTAPSGMLWTTQNVGATSSDSNVNAGGATTSVTLVSGEHNATIDAGLVAQNALGNYVWLDDDHSGTQNEAAGMGINGVTVTLMYYNGSSYVVYPYGVNTQVTANDLGGNPGYYTFTNLFPGTYQVQFTLPNGYTWTVQTSATANGSDVDNTGRTNDVVMGATTVNPDIDAGVWQSAGLGDYVWEDMNRDGVQDFGESAVPTVTVKLYEDGVLTDTTQTDINGYYQFVNLFPGRSYTVVFDMPVGFDEFTVVNNAGSTISNSTNADDSNADAAGESKVIVLTSGQFNPTIDAGVFKYASLGDYVWFDGNADGKQDANEPPVSGVTVHLYQGGSVVMTTTTDASGLYTFSSLLPGVPYSVSFTAPSGMEWTTPNNGKLTQDSNADANGATASVTLDSGEHNPTIDAGLVAPNALGNYVWLDDDHNGVQNEAAGLGLNGITVTLMYFDGSSYVPYPYGANETVTADDLGGNPGYYTFTNLFPGTYQVQFALPSGYAWTVQTNATPNGSDVDNTGLTGDVVMGATTINPDIDAGVWQSAGLGDYVWEDANRNGTQDLGESAIPSITVKLYENGVLTGTTQTDASGLYQFTNLFPGANYTVAFSLPAGYDAFTLQNNAGATVSNTTNADDSNADVNGVSQVIVLSSGQFNPTIDAGVFKYASLGDQVWFDVNKDGLQDPTEPFVPNVTVTLYEAGVPSITKQTDASGFYDFINLLPGVPYSVEFTLPNGYTFTQMLGVPSTVAGDSNAYWDGSTDVITLTTGQHDPTIDAGLIAPNALGNYVWVDDNYDGLQTEPITRGVNGVTVTLLYLSGTNYIPYPYGVNELLTADDVNGNAGYYTFTNLFPGTYQVQFDLPSGYAGYQFTQQNVDPANGSDANGSGRTGDIAMAADTINPDVDAGIWQTASLGDYVWEDMNHDGLQDKTEPLIPNVTVTLYAPSGRNFVLTATTQTDANGMYTFTNLFPGVSYYVHFDLPSGYHYSNPVNSGDPDPSYSNDSNPDVVTGDTPVIILSSGEHNPSIDAGLWRGAGLGDYVWFDWNRDGVQDANESGVSGVTVTLYENGVVTASMQTAANGGYSFGGLTPDVPYSVTFTLPNGFQFTDPLNAGAGVYSDSNASPFDGTTAPITLASNEYNPSIDAGVWAQMSLGNRVWLDTNNDGLLNNGEVGVDGVAVELYRDTDSNGVYTPGTDALISTTVTAETGYYTFTNLLPVGYIVVLPQSNFVAGAPLFGYHSSTPTAVSPNDDVNNNDDGVETGSVTATQYVASRVINLYPGTEPTNDEAPVEDFYASGDWNSNYSVDFGFYKLTVGNVVWEDINNNGVIDNGEPMLPNVLVTLYNSLGNTVISTTQTDANGYYQFSGMLAGDYVIGVMPPAGYASSTGAGQEADPDTNGDNNDNGVVNRGSGEIRSASFTLAAGSDVNRPNNTVDNATATTANPTVDFGLWQPAALGNRVWFDVNHDGVQDPAETGVSNIRVWLLDVDGNHIMTATTNASGYYTFSNLISGTYSVQFDLTTLPTGRLVSTQNAGGDDAIDSDASVATGMTQQVTLFPGDANPTLDMGIWQPAGLGDYVWHDQNANGQQDAGEPSVSNVTVVLYTVVGGQTTVVATTTTNANGYYSFTNLIPGVDYVVHFDAPNGYTYTQPLVGNPASDSNPDRAGNSGVITLQPGEFNDTIDAGVVVPAQLGNYVWLDLNQNGQQNVGEQPVPGVTVTLYAGGQPVATTTTDAGGQYTFTNLLPGVPYTVVFTPPPGMQWTTPNTGVDTGDSDANGGGMSAPVVLVSGENNTSLDAGLLPGLVLDKVATTSGPNNTVGKDQVITYTIRITNVTSVAMVNVVVTDALPSGLAFVAGSSTPAQISDAPLKWQFNVLLAGESKSIVFRTTVQPGTVSLLTNVAYVSGGPISGIVASDDAQSTSDPTAIALASFTAKAEKNGVRVAWATSLEQDTFGFHLYRAESQNRDDAKQVTSELIAATGRNGGANYEFVDSSADSGKTYTYWLQETEVSGVTHEYGPVSSNKLGAEQPVVNNTALQPVLTTLAGGVALPKMSEQHELVQQVQNIQNVQKVEPAQNVQQVVVAPVAAPVIAPVAAANVAVPAVPVNVAVSAPEAQAAPASAEAVVAAPVVDAAMVNAMAEQSNVAQASAAPAAQAPAAQVNGVQVLAGTNTAQKSVLGVKKADQPSTQTTLTTPKAEAKPAVSTGLIAGLIGLVAAMGVAAGWWLRKRQQRQGESK